jgi:hypothetical protein
LVATANILPMANGLLQASSRVPEDGRKPLTMWWRVIANLLPCIKPLSCCRGLLHASCHVPEDCHRPFMLCLRYGSILVPFLVCSKPFAIYQRSMPASWHVPMGCHNRPAMCQKVITKVWQPWQAVTSSLFSCPKWMILCPGVFVNVRKNVYIFSTLTNAWDLSLVENLLPSRSVH